MVFLFELRLSLVEHRCSVPLPLPAGVFLPEERVLSF